MKVNSDGEVVKHGLGIEVTSNGDIYHGEWVDNIAEGDCIWVNSAEDRYIGLMKNGTEHGHGKYWYNTGDYYEGDCKHTCHNQLQG